jgi:hypothetical protein
VVHRHTKQLNSLVMCLIMVNRVVEIISTHTKSMVHRHTKQLNSLVMCLIMLNRVVAIISTHTKSLQPIFLYRILIDCFAVVSKLRLTYSD